MQNLSKKDRIAALEAQLEADRTTLANHISALDKELNSRFWLTEGRGSYEWNDDRYRQEFGDAVRAILGKIEPLRKIAADFTNCPKTRGEVIQARMDQERRIAALEAALLLIRHTPAMPFPDPAAHSYRAFGDAVFAAWSAIQHITDTALASGTAALDAALERAREEGRHEGRMNQMADDTQAWERAERTEQEHDALHAKLAEEKELHSGQQAQYTAESTRLAKLAEELSERNDDLVAQNERLREVATRAVCGCIIAVHPSKMSAAALEAGAAAEVLTACTRCKVLAESAADSLEAHDREVRRKGLEDAS